MMHLTIKGCIVSLSPQLVTKWDRGTTQYTKDNERSETLEKMGAERPEVLV